ncbi:ABC-type spermidine/putrescine transport system permease subunit II [Pseudomonas psychrotolerans]|nr:ABC-type spermidine/putrescine transport system permease subunit II [Pseudomonas psychrotolerans]
MRGLKFTNLMLVLGLLFIYLPMVILVIYSFNESRLVTVWGGWSVKWYVGLVDNSQLMGAVFRSLEIAFYTAISSVILGTLAAFVLTRIPRFRGRTLFGGMVTAPLVMPEVITGLSLLLLFVSMAQLIGWPQDRGVATIWIAHTSFCSSYVAVVVSARLRELDLSIEEAAMDLGARPWKVFLLITIPMIAPSLAAGGMMSFALSLDDLVLASFVSGPGSTTLPMEVFSAVRLGVKPEINAIASPHPAGGLAVHLLRLVLHPARREEAPARTAGSHGCHGFGDHPARPRNGDPHGTPCQQLSGFHPLSLWERARVRAIAGTARNCTAAVRSRLWPAAEEPLIPSPTGRGLG